TSAAHTHTPTHQSPPPSLLATIPPPPRSTLFPYTTLFRSARRGRPARRPVARRPTRRPVRRGAVRGRPVRRHARARPRPRVGAVEPRALEHDTHAREQLAQRARALGAGRERVVGEGLVDLEGVLARGAAVGVRRHGSPWLSVRSRPGAGRAAHGNGPAPPSMPGALQLAHRP